MNGIMRDKHNFCYLTGTNRHDDLPIIKGMLKRARDAGVTEDLHVFAPLPVEGCIFHHFTGDWRKHMVKIDFLKELKDSGYDYVVWIDSDTYFVRDPGSLDDLIRDEKCWVSMESDFHSPEAKFNEWYGLFIKNLPSPPLPADKLSPSAFDVYKQFGAKYAFNTNGGMFIVRRDAIEEFHRRTNEVFNQLHAMGFHTVPDEPPLAIVGDLMVNDPLKNTFTQHKHRWACDWHGRFGGSLPDGNDWMLRDWLTQADVGMGSPDIVHLMRGKHLLAAYGRPVEPVGTKMAEIIAEAGIAQPEGCSCRTMQGTMDNWGIEGCLAHRKEILLHLAEASDNASWLDFAKMAAKGVFSCGQLLERAIERASAV